MTDITDGDASSVTIIGAKSNNATAMHALERDTKVGTAVSCNTCHKVRNQSMNEKWDSASNGPIRPNLKSSSEERGVLAPIF